MFHDPIYYGKLIQSEQSTTLMDIYNFQPMITEEIYNQVQALGYGRTKDHSPKKRVTFYPLHGFVYCAICNSSQYTKVGRNTSGSGKQVLSYRCDNKLCTRSPRSLRARNVFNSIYTMLDSFKVSDAAYERYSTDIDDHTNDKIMEIKQQINSKRGMLAHISKEITDRALNIGLISEDLPAYKPNADRLQVLAIQQADLSVEISDLEAKIANPSRIKLNKEEFLNLLKTASDKMKAGSAVEKDILCRILFLNLRIDNEKVVDYLWNEPFASMIKLGEIQVGGGGWT
jgi:ACT domain-containing protein